MQIPSTGKLWIDGRQAKTPDSSALICSGVCLENADYLTIVHTLRHLAEEERKICIADLMDPKTANAVVSVGAQSREMTKNTSGGSRDRFSLMTDADQNSDPTLRSVHLVAENAELDIAVFRIEDNPRMAGPWG